MEPSLLEVLPNLSIGVVSVIALVYITYKFLEHLEEQSANNLIALTEREDKLRDVEREIRSLLTEQVAKNTAILAKNSDIISEAMRTQERVLNRLDRN